MGIDIIFERNARLLFAIELERYVADTRIFGIIIYKFYHGQEFCQVILLSINKNLEIRLHYTVLPLYLIIYLMLESFR